eukprot:310046_1
MESFISPTRGDWASRDLPEIPHPIHQSPHFRAVRHKSVIERVEERAQRRDQAIQDLLHSESQYNVLLGLLIHHYVSPLSDHKLINSKQHKTLFPALHSIKDLSDKFLHELRQRRKKWLPNVTKLSDLFETFTPFFRMYQHHVNNQEKALDLLSQLSQNKRWIVFCQKAQIHCQRMPLSDLLILPSEQLVAYDETLIRIVESTSPHHPDYSDLVKSQESLHHEVESMKLKMIEYNRKENVRKIERRLKGKIDLLEPHRAFICEGKLWKISARSRKDRIYTFFLFNDLLIYASAFGNKYKIHNMLPMNDKFAAEMIVTSASYGIDKKDRIFCIKSEKKSIVVYADTVPLAQQWVTQLNECWAQQLAPVQPPAHRQSRARQFARIQQQQANHPRHTQSVGAKESLSETLPVWVPDSHVTNCSICMEKFTFTTRKHHCRKCGGVVCSKCSKYKILNAEGVKQRACKRCFAINSNMGNTLTPQHPAGARAKSCNLQQLQTIARKPKRSDTTGDVALFFGVGDSDDGSDASDFENEIAALYALPYYVESNDYTSIFSKFGHGIGSYMLIPSAMDFDEYYSVHLVVQTAHDLMQMNGFELFKICLFEKRNAMVFRLQKKSHKTRAFASMDKLLKYLQNKENLVFSHAILRSEVEKTVHHSIKHIYVADMERYPKAQALYDYESKDDADLTFAAGDTICVWDKSDTAGGWWKGVIGDRVGLFPSNYVQLLATNDDENANINTILDQIVEEEEEEEKSINLKDAADAYHAMDVMSGVYDELVDRIDIDSYGDARHVYDTSNYTEEHHHHATVIEHISHQMDPGITSINHYDSHCTVDDIKVSLYDDHQQHDPMDGMDGATRYFYIFLRNNKLDQYFAGFKDAECCDIRDIEYLMDDVEFLKNQIGIRNLIHRRKLMGEFSKLKHKMDEFKNSNLIPNVLVDKLVTNGIVTMDLLCSQCQSKQDLIDKFNIRNENQLNLLWNIIDIQINPHPVPDHLLRQRTDRSRTEGCVKLKPQNSPKIGFMTPQHADDEGSMDTDGNDDDDAPPPPPPAPPVPPQ